MIPFGLVQKKKLLLLLLLTPNNKRTCANLTTRAREKEKEMMGAHMRGTIFRPNKCCF